MKIKTLLLMATSLFYSEHHLFLNVFNVKPPKTEICNSKKLLSNGRIDFSKYQVINNSICGREVTLDLTAPVLWSSPSTWTALNMTKPVAGSMVTIPAGSHIILDETPPALAGLDIKGKLEFANQNIDLSVGYILVTGTFQIGTVQNPYTQKATITLTESNQSASHMNMGTRGIIVMGGVLELHGVPPTKMITKLSDHASSGTNNLSLIDAVSWNVGDQVVVSSTDFYNPLIENSQRMNISTVNSGNSITLGGALNTQRWGKLQYLTATGMSLTPGTLPANLVAGTPTVLDERAEVANLTRNIVIQSIDDAAWQNNGFGCHIMIMNMNGIQGVAHVDGIEIRRGGQSGRLGRYPFHWHMLSYENGVTLADATGQYIKNSTVNQSKQRGIVVHGTNGVLVSKNIIYDVKGHGIFTEDASERRNTFDGNFVARVRNIAPENILKLHEGDNAIGSSGFWISNPDNIIINNTATDCQGAGYWLAFPEKTFGLSASSTIGLKPSYLRFGEFRNNVAHSNATSGIHLDDVELDENGDTGPFKYYPSSNGEKTEWPYEYALTFELTDYVLWKNNQSGIWNRSGQSRNRRVVSADNTTKFFSGASDTNLPGAVETSLLVGKSLNYNMNGVTRPTSWGSYTPVGFASYHSTFDITNNVIVNFEGVADDNKPAGAFALDDYYLIPVDKGTVRNPGNILINSHPGIRTDPSGSQFVFGVIWDHHNYWGGPADQDNYYVYPNPFFTHGLTETIVAPSKEVSHGVIVDGPFYGFNAYYVNQTEVIYDKINTIRTTADGTIVGNWTVEAGQFGDILGNMRHFATHPTGFYYLDFPTLENINDIRINVTNMLTDNDYQVLSVEYSGNYKITNLFSSTSYNMMEFGGSVEYPEGTQWVNTYTKVANFQAVVDAPQGEVYWQDRVNNKVWFKVRGGVGNGDSSLPDTNDANLYKEFKVRAYGSEDLLSTNPNIAANNKKLKVFPNPVGSSEISLSWNNTSDTNDSVKIFNIIGQMVYQKEATQQAGENLLKVDASNWAAGLYIVQVGNAVVKLIKN